MNKLNQRQELFCINYVSGMTAKSAAIKAGYSSTNTDKLLKTTSIIERLAILRAPAIVRANSTREAKLEILENIYTHEPLPEDITARDRIRAVAEHNRMEKVYSEPVGTTDNRQYNLIVMGEDARKNLSLLLEGKKPKEIDG